MCLGNSRGALGQPRFLLYRRARNVRMSQARAAVEGCDSEGCDSEGCDVLQATFLGMSIGIFVFFMPTCAWVIHVEHLDSLEFPSTGEPEM